MLALPDGSNGALAIDVKYREAVQRIGVKPTHLLVWAGIVPAVGKDPAQMVE